MEGNTVAHDMNSKFAKKFLCSIDGSRYSQLAYKCTKSLMKKSDKITLFHVFSRNDKGKNNPSRLEEEYETELIGTFHRSRYSILWHNRDYDERSVKDILEDISKGDYDNVDAPDFMVLGYSGWKFDSDGNREEATSAGSTTDFCLRHIRNPIVIVKRDCEPGPNHFVMTVNGSNASKLGLDILYALVGPRDSLTVITISEHSRADAAIEDYYAAELLENCPTTSTRFESIQRTGSDTIHDTLNDYLRNLENGLDFLVIAPRSRVDNIFSSFTERVIQDVKANIILCKV